MTADFIQVPVSCVDAVLMRPTVAKLSAQCVIELVKL